MKLFLLFLLSTTTQAGLFSDSFFNTRSIRPRTPLCKDNKPTQNYSLTIYAYNEAEKGIPLEKASAQLKQLANQYDELANETIPARLLKSIIHQSDDSGRGADIGYFVELSSNLYANLSFIPASSRGDELVICPTPSCKNLVVPKINKTIEDFSESSSAPDYKKTYGVKENHFDKIWSMDLYNRFSENYFMYDLLSKSGLSLGEYYKDTYFVIPEIDQAKICKDVKQKLPNHPNNEVDGCFKSNLHKSSEYHNFNENLQRDKRGNSVLDGTHLSRSHGALRCCPETINGYCQSGYEGPCYLNDTQKMSYMDAVARDYAEKIMFDIEKKNEGKWTVFNIKLNADFICKYGRSKSELLTK